MSSAKDRVAVISNHLTPIPTLGEQGNLSKDANNADNHSGAVFTHRYARIPIKIWYREQEEFKERYGGGHGLIVLEGELIKPVDLESKTVVIFMHPMGIQNMLPLPIALARSGVHVVTCTSRYPNNDSALIMEKVVLDLGACIRHCKEKLNYSKVVLAGWSGGGSLSALYQSQAEKPTITRTPAGDLPDLTKANLIPADGLMMLAAHTGRATIMTEWLDPAVTDELEPFMNRILELDLYDDRNPNKPPYTKEYVERFRLAQYERNRRITAWAKEKLKKIKESNDGEVEHCFVVYGTMADPRWMDLSLEPNGRKGPNWCFLGKPKAVNNGPVGVARFCTLRSWLSQWSVDDSNANALVHLPHVTKPILVVGNSDDDGVPVSHTHALFGAVQHSDKEFCMIQNANHYYEGQKGKQEDACLIIMDWMNRKQLLEPAIPLARKPNV